MTALYLLLTLVVGALILIAIINIQWVHGDEWRARAEKREAGLRTDPARRGNIYSSDGKILATTVTECDLYLDLDTTVISDSLFKRYIDTVCLMLQVPGRHS